MKRKKGFFYKFNDGRVWNFEYELSTGLNMTWNVDDRISDNNSLVTEIM